MISIRPQFSKSRVNKAGNAFRSGRYSAEDVAAIENWRASHAHVLNTFQMNLRRKTQGRDIVVAQRLKRRETIFSKLAREPMMQLARMHDIAGCRLIFRNVAALQEFRGYFNSSRISHPRQAADDDRYNYIALPKDTGYRGVHDVFEYNSNKASGLPWKGLKVEIQYRTIYQHAWATAVEVAGLLTKNRPKFKEADALHMDFFRASSEIIARAFEGSKACLPDISNDDLIDLFFILIQQ